MIHNPKFKVVEFDHFRMQAGIPNFTLSATERIEKTNASIVVGNIAIGRHLNHTQVPVPVTNSLWVSLFMTGVVVSSAAASSPFVKASLPESFFIPFKYSAKVQINYNCYNVYFYECLQKYSKKIVMKTGTHTRVPVSMTRSKLLLHYYFLSSNNIDALSRDSETLAGETIDSDFG